MVKLSVRGLVGTIKDKASQGRAAVTSSSLLLPLLRATTHDPRAPPRPKHIAAVLALGRSSRASASAAVEALMDRLSKTRDAYVALKCLIAAHHVASSGGFILRDQLSVVPAAGGRNYLNLSKFRDVASHVTWRLSDWVRWYGEYLECLVSLSRALGRFLGEMSPESEISVAAVSNAELVRETESLVRLVEQIARRPENIPGEKVVEEVTAMVGRDLREAMGEIRIRVVEFGERLACLSFGESVELVCALKRLLSCRDSLGLGLGFEDLGFWSLVGHVISDRSSSSPFGNKLLRKNDLWTESARFPDRVPRPVDLVKFGSGRLSVSAF